jgi:hypothetical protein
MKGLELWVEQNAGTAVSSGRMAHDVTRRIGLETSAAYDA